MNIFECIKKWIETFLKWLKSLFNPIKKPIIKITVLTFLCVIFMSNNLYSQRTDLEGVYAYFIQNDQIPIDEVDQWTLFWYDEQHFDSMSIYKNDTLRVKIFNPQTNEWVIYVDNLSDSVKLRVEHPILLDTEWTMYIKAKDLYGHSVDSEHVKVYFMASDVNKIIDSCVDGGFYVGDKSVDGLDLIQLAKEFGKTGVEYNVFTDITGDGNVDGLDLIQLARDFGRHWTP